MKTYRSLPVGVHHAERRLGIVTAACARQDDQTIEDVAAQQGCSPALVYKLIARTRDALLPVRPGPRSGTRVPAATTSPSSKAPVRTGVDLVALVSVLTVHHVSIRGIREVFAALGLRAPGNSTLVAWVREAGAAARRLMARANTQLRPRVECLAGDDIFFHREAVKVLMEPVDAAVLEVLRWPDRSAESWQLWLADWPAHTLFVSDLGTDLTGATDRDQRLTPIDVRQIIAQTARPIVGADMTRSGSPTQRGLMGHGLIDAAAAVRVAQMWTQNQSRYVAQLVDSGGAVVRTAPVDPGGNFRFNDVPPGMYAVRGGNDVDGDGTIGESGELFNESMTVVDEDGDLEVDLEGR